MYRRICLWSLLGLVLTTPVVAGAQCASPATSTFPQAIVVCPSGDINVICQILDAAGNPCINAQIFMSFSANCVGSLWVAPLQPYPILVAATNLAGGVVFNPRMGGCCTAGVVQFYDASGLVLASVPVVNSPDVTANGVVDLSDIASFATIFFGGSPLVCADFAYDGALNLSDVAVLARHIGH